MQVQLWDIVEKSKHTRVWIASSRPIDDKIGSDLIMWYQDTDYSHVLIIINDMVFQASHGYANAVPMSHFLKENKIINRIEIQKDKCDFKYLFLTLGTKYGFTQLWKIALKYILVTRFKIIRRFKYKDNGTKNVICSEYVGNFLRLDWVNDLTDPEDIITYLESIKANHQK